jgi:REP element-mobilizing transposase RayT
MLYCYCYFMPGRIETFRNSCIYHVFNRTIDKKKIFLSPQLANYFLESVYFYRSTYPDRCFSHFRGFSTDRKQEWIVKLSERKCLQVNILTFSIMPTHYHFLLYQRKANGIQTFMTPYEFIYSILQYKI